MLKKRSLTDGRILVIREASSKDAAVLLEYLSRISQETDFLTFGPGEFLLTKEEEARYLEKINSADNCLYLVALIAAELAGILILEAGSRPRIRHSGELVISVLKEFWGNGIASDLIDALVSWARNGKIIKKINLKVRADNKRAISLYRRKGFLVEGRLKKQIFLKGKYFDNLFMGLEI